jgi:hypothetical protein
MSPQLADLVAKVFLHCRSKFLLAVHANGMQGIELVLRIKPRHDLVRFDPVADIRQSLDHAPPDTKGETGLVLCLGRGWPIRSALPQSPDLGGAHWHFAFVPKADHRGAAKASLLDHLVGEGEQLARHVEAERPLRIRPA